MPDVFGDLRDWGRVIHKIGQLRREGILHEHLDGLVRVLRYRYNWQLRQAAIESVQDVAKPNRPLLDALLVIASDETVQLEFRLLACGAVNHVLWRCGSLEGGSGLRRRAALEAETILSGVHEPVLRTAIERWAAWESARGALQASAGLREEERDSPLNPGERTSFLGPAGDSVQARGTNC